MPRIQFEDLVRLYRSLTLPAIGGDGVIALKDDQDADVLRQIDEDDRWAEDANIVIHEPTEIEAGKQVRARIGPPALRLGVLASTFDDLLNAPDARLKEPLNYFVLSGLIERETQPPTPDQTGYRSALKLVSLLAEAAAYVDRTRGEMVFLSDSKFSIPLAFTRADIISLKHNDADEFAQIFSDPTHKEQKLALLGDVAVRLSQSQPPLSRLPYLLKNISHLVREIKDGYRIYVSEFSYEKIRSEIAAAKVDYIGKIHKTFSDIQGQLLGIPLGTVVIATQLKVAAACGPEVWGNRALLMGSWLYILFLVIALGNQWVTLGAIKDEIQRQRTKIKGEYAELNENFGATFTALVDRAWWHQFGLVCVGLATIVAGIVAAIAYSWFTGVGLSACWS